MDTSTCVAEITQEFWSGDEVDDVSYVGKKFELGALINWWGHDEDFSAIVDPASMTEFAVYDDDGELYYRGWLLDDNQSLVQQFVLAWAEANDGATTIKVKRDGKWVQDIG